MAEFVRDVPVPGAGTFFCTQPYTALDPSQHELCPHPTLEAGDDWDAELDSKCGEFPGARGVRTHSCVHSHLLSIELRRRGFDWVSTRDEPGRADIEAYREAWGVWHLPIYYMDTLDISFARHWEGSGHSPFARELLETAVRGDGLYVFDFHPIHLLLNSTSADEYLERRDGFRAGDPLDGLRCEGYGARSYYDDLLGLMDDAGAVSARMSDAVPAAIES